MGDQCEGCGSADVVGFDSEGVALCKGCAEATLEDAKDGCARHSLYIEAKVYAGANIYDAACAMCAAAERTGACIVADFNGMELLARPGDRAEDVAGTFDSRRCHWLIGEGSKECGAAAEWIHRGSGLRFCEEHGRMLTERAGLMLVRMEREARP